MKIEIDLNQVEIQHTENHSNIVDLGNGVHLEMRYPTYTTLSNLKNTNAVDVTFEMIEKCIDKVIQGEEVMELKDFSKADVKEFLDSLTSQNFRNSLSLILLSQKTKGTFIIERSSSFTGL